MPAACWKMGHLVAYSTSVYPGWIGRSQSTISARTQANFIESEEATAVKQRADSQAEHAGH